MIFDTLSQAGRYTALSPGFAPAFAFLRQVREETPSGRYDLDGDKVFALVQRYLTKPYAECQYESHRKYIDIQYVVSGRERIYWAPLPRLTDITMPFDEAKDAALYRIISDGLPLEVHPGQFAILYPHDGHAPACAWGKPTEVVKVVVKVQI